jgi:hypothetical protein
VAARLAGYTTTTAVLGNQKVMKVRQWQCYSQPSETYFEVRARVETTKGQVQGIADGLSDTIEALLGATAITAVSWAQDVNAAGQLTSIYTVYYYEAGNDVSGFVEIPVGRFNLTDVAEAVIGDVAASGYSVNL